MTRALTLVLGLFLLTAAFPPRLASAADFRPPSVPLVTHDPYFSVWSPADKLTDAATVHWTGKRNAMTSMVRIDGQVYRLMGPEPADVPALPQIGLLVTPTRTTYYFGSDDVKVVLMFLSPQLPDDLDLLTRPVTYLRWEAFAKQGQKHDVSVYFEVSPEWAVNTPDQKVNCTRAEVSGLNVLRAGSREQRILGRSGDDLRIEWGYLYAAVAESKQSSSAIAPAAEARAAFLAGKELPKDGATGPRPAADSPVMAFVMDFGEVQQEPVPRLAYLAYDDLYGIRYFGAKLRPYWRRNGAEAANLLKGAAAVDFPTLMSRCMQFDKQFKADLTAAGGEKYAQIGALAYRQCLAAHKIVADAKGMPLAFSKENFSNGCIATVDVIYPAAPQFLLFSPGLMKAALVPVLDYSMSPRWKFSFAPHDLGQYPLAEGQVYGEGERGEKNQMPVEESGNMLLLMAAVAQIDGNAEFSAKYWPVLSKWAEYLKSKGFDPEMQLCTDDFAGHLAHNVNLSAKAILGLGAYARLADMLGKQDVAAEYRKTAEEFAARWVKEADDGDHYKLTFDKSGTWSQKYNLAWDRVLGLNLFPPEVAKKEMAYYRKVQNPYGLPLDSRKTYTKLDWILWTATLTGAREDFEALAAPVWEFLNTTPDRVPMTDWYETKSAKRVGFQARSVVGGVFMPMLADPAAWKAWAGRAAKVQGDWAPMPTPPQTRALVPASNGREGAKWRYTFAQPGDDWFRPDFDDSGWKEGPAGFGSEGTPGAVVRTEWTTPDIWIRREFKLPADKPGEPLLLIHHDEDAEVYINGEVAADVSGYTTGYELVEMDPPAQAALQSDVNVLAVHCHQTAGGQYIDVGIVEMVK